MDKYLPNIFFDLKNFEFKELFTEDEGVWEAVKKLASFLALLFKEGKVRGNHSENVYVDPSASVDPTARILGPAIIGKGAKIGFSAFLRENVIIGENSQVRFSEVKNSILLNNVLANHMCYIGDSILGNNTNIGSGAKLANLRLDKEEIKIKLDGENFINTGLQKLGAIVGDGCQIGVNAVLNPATFLGKNSIVFPLTSVSGYFEEKSLIK